MSRPPLLQKLDLAKYQMKIWKTLLSGPPYRSELDKIILDLTNYCDLDCPHCNRSCGTSQAPSNKVLTLGQIQRFIGESIEHGKGWKRILLEGGEPTLHPDIHKIIDLLIQYRGDHSPACELVLVTNGHGQRSKELIREYSGYLKITNSNKSPEKNNGHIPFHRAPADLPGFSGFNFSSGCYLHKMYGLGLTYSGFYPHPVCGGIDRVFGLDIGMKSLPEKPEDLIHQMEKLCRLCGHFIEYYRGKGKVSLFRFNRHHRLTGPGPSATWRKALRNYKNSIPEITLY